LVLGYAALASVIEPAELEPVILADPDDDAVLACAVAARGDVIVSGDSHLLDLKKYLDIRIMTAAELIVEIL
jgi:predicted nucleic acid-binding protein